MKVRLDVPDALASPLAGQAGDLSRAALEALAAEAYREDRLTGLELRSCSVFRLATTWTVFSSAPA